MYDEGGVIRQGKEAVEVWRSYFEKVLNEGGNSKDQRGGNVLGGESSWIDEGITREEVEQASSTGAGPIGCTHTKKRVRGVCRMDEFRGISLVPV